VTDEELVIVRELDAVRVWTVPVRETLELIGEEALWESKKMLFVGVVLFDSVPENVGDAVDDELFVKGELAV
jgi:hypothetical protein